MELHLTKRNQETSDVESFFFESPQSMEWKAGQFGHYVLHHRPTDDRGSDRWFTNAAAPFENTIRITTRKSSEQESSFKKTLFGLSIGDTIEIANIEGDFTITDLSQKYVFIAGGIGITPFRSILTQLDHEGMQPTITLLYANRDENVVYKEELESIASRNPNLHIHYITAPQRIDAKLIQQLVPDLQSPIFYISGPEPMVEALGDTLQQIGAPKEHLMQDFFPGYPAE